MDIRFQAGGADKWKADIALIPIREGEKITDTCPELDSAAPYLVIAPAMRDVSGRKDEISLIYGHPDLPYSRVMLIGLGREAVTPDSLRRAYALGTRRARAMHLRSLQIPAFTLQRFGGVDRLLEEAVYACKLADYEVSGLKHRKPGDPEPISFLSVNFTGEYVPEKEQAAARKGEDAADTVILARNLINTPANMMYPEAFAEEARRLAEGTTLSCTVYDEKQLSDMGFNAHLAVGQGGKNPPRLVVLEYTPKGHENDDPLVFVGKGITFDSGGISLKPAANMHTMKCDMTGAAAVLTSVSMLAREEVPHRVVGIMALAENMPDGGAVHPGDVVTGLNGSTIEIINTDAEGRLVLSDALTFAQKNWHPAAVVDVATLTGACATALGDQVAGLFSNDTELAERVISAGSCAGENYWRMPLWEGYRGRLESTVADICHTGSSREGGAIVAALFLEHFISEGTRWAHLDIAGEDWVSEAKPLCPKGASGFAARTLLELGRGGFE